MDNPGPLQLPQSGGAFSITKAGTLIGDVIDDLSGLEAVTLQAQFLYGSGGESVTAYVQTSLDQGQTWIDIAAIQFTTAGGAQVINLSGLTPKTVPVVPTQQGLAAGSCVDGLLGDRLRAVVVVAGTYGGGSLLNLTGVAR